MAKFASISNGMYTNQYDSEVKITAFMANSTDKQVKMFSTVFPVPSGQFQISLDPILGKTKQINDIFNKRGFLAGSTSGEVQLTEKTTSISLKTDYVFLNSDKKGIEMSGNILDAMIKGEGFMHNSAYHKIVGTNGTYKKGFNTNTNMFFGKLLELDGRLIIPDAATDGGNAITIGNIRKTAYDKTCNYLVMEIISKFDDDTADGLRLVYTMNSDVNWSDATDANEVSFTQTQLCDVRFTNMFLTEGYGAAEVGADVPARRVRFNKRPVSMFKAVLDTDVVDVTSETTFGLDAIDMPKDVVESNLSLGIFEESAYDVAVSDVAVFYVPGDETSETYKRGYGLAVCTETATVAGNVAVALSAGMSATDNIIELDALPEFVAAAIAVGDNVIITVGTGTPSKLLKVTAANASPADVTFSSNVGISGAAAADVTFELVTATFTVIKNEYDLKESVVYSNPAASVTATIEDAVTPILEFDFEETIFKQLV